LFSPVALGRFYLNSFIQFFGFCQGAEERVVSLSPPRRGKAWKKFSYRVCLFYKKHIRAPKKCTGFIAKYIETHYTPYQEFIPVRRML